jgi:hypothetical protein
MTMPTIMLPFTTPRPRVTTLLEAIKEVVNRMVGASMSLDHHGAPTFRACADGGGRTTWPADADVPLRAADG